MAINVDEDPFQVYLNVYDVTNANPLLRCLGFSFYLSSIQVHGQEHMFRPDNGDGNLESGIISGDQGQLRWCQGLTLRGSIRMGRTEQGPNQVQQQIQELRDNHDGYTGVSYRLSSNNCHHFSDRLCQALTGHRIPQWVNRIAKIGPLCKCMVPVDELNAELRRSNGDAADPSHVYLNVYDASAVAGPLLRVLGIPFYRSTVQVHGREYAFRPRPMNGPVSDEEEQQIVSAPKGELDWCRGLRLHKFIRIGPTEFDPQSAAERVNGLQGEFNLDSYHHRTKNCHHFSDRACRELAGKGIPPWVNHTATVGHFGALNEVTTGLLDNYTTGNDSDHSNDHGHAHGGSGGDDGHGGGDDRHGDHNHDHDRDHGSEDHGIGAQDHGIGDHDLGVVAHDHDHDHEDAICDGLLGCLMTTTLMQMQHHDHA